MQENREHNTEYIKREEDFSGKKVFDLNRIAKNK